MFLVVLLGFISLVILVGSLIYWVKTNSLLAFIVFIVMVIYLFTSEGIEKQKFPDTHYYEEKVIVSSSPSHQYIEGRVGGGFLLFSGMIEQKRAYLLREEIEEGLYKDFTVKEEVYLKEDPLLKSKGKFKQYFTCKHSLFWYDVYGLRLLETKEETCSYTKQVISVPVGSVIKEIKI